MMDGSGLSVADAIALEGRNNCCNDGCGNGLLEVTELSGFFSFFSCLPDGATMDGEEMAVQMVPDSRDGQREPTSTKVLH